MSERRSYLDTFKDLIIETIAQYPGLKTYLVNYVYYRDSSIKTVVIVRLWSVKEEYDVYSIMNQLSKGQTYQENFEETITLLAERLHAVPVFDIRYI